MKYLGHVPTEQYGFISFELEGTVDEATEAYRALQRTWASGPGLSLKEMDSFLDQQLSGNGIKDGVEIYEKMNSEQKDRVQWLKRGLKRNK